MNARELDAQQDEQIKQLAELEEQAKLRAELKEQQAKRLAELTEENEKLKALKDALEDLFLSEKPHVPLFSDNVVLECIQATLSRAGLDSDVNLAALKAKSEHLNQILSVITPINEVGLLTQENFDLILRYAEYGNKLAMELLSQSSGVTQEHITAAFGKARDQSIELHTVDETFCDAVSSLLFRPAQHPQNSHDQKGQSHFVKPS